MSAFDPIRSMAEARREFGEHGGVNPSIETSVTFTVMKPDIMSELGRGRYAPDAEGCYLYGRHYSPTVYALSRQLAALEGAEAAYCTSSGMAAISSVLLELCDAGAHVVASDAVYGGTFGLLRDYLPAKTGLRVDFVDVQDVSAVQEALSSETSVLYVETLTNPTLKVADLEALSKLAHACGAQLVVDNTFSPLLVSPLQHGADVVVHSLTKFINGASDLVAGVVCGRASLIDRLMDANVGTLMMLGPTMDPRVANEIHLRLPHLGLRMQEHGRRAQCFAERLFDRGERVLYPGLAEHPGHALLTRMANAGGYAGGGMLSLDLGTTERAYRLMELLQNETGFGLMAVSLGYAETLMSCSASTTSSELSPEDRERTGLSPGLVRMSIGITGTLEQRWSALREALDRLGDA